jgi:hypothetical protein
MCLAPLLLLGVLTTLPVNAANVTAWTSPLLEVQTCERGPGLYAKASPVGVGSLGLQYGLTWDPAPAWRLTLTPQAGLGLVGTVPELSSTANFSLGGQLALGYQRTQINLGYWHISNAGLGDVNTGLDMLTVMGGWAWH